MNKKSVAYVCAFLFGFTSLIFSSDNSIYQENAKESISAASDIAIRDRKGLLLFFGADWCPDCRALIKAMADPHLKAYLSERYIIVMIDVGHFDKNMEMREKYGIPRSVGMPALALINTRNNHVNTSLNEKLPNARNMSVQQITDEFNKIPIEE
jgi:thioredoxin 1